MTTKRTSSKATEARRTKKSTSKKTMKQKSTAKPSTQRKRSKPARDPRLPAVGSTLTRIFKGKEIVVEVVEGGFHYKGKTFKSISACARHITGYMISGPVFFKLAEPKPAKTKKRS